MIFVVLNTKGNEQDAVNALTISISLTTMYSLLFANDFGSLVKTTGFPLIKSTATHTNNSGS